MKRCAIRLFAGYIKLTYAKDCGQDRKYRAIAPRIIVAIDPAPKAFKVDSSMWVALKIGGKIVHCLIYVFVLRFVESEIVDTLWD